MMKRVVPALTLVSTLLLTAACSNPAPTAEPSTSVRVPSFADPSPTLPPYTVEGFDVCTDEVVQLLDDLAHSIESIDGSRQSESFRECEIASRSKSGEEVHVRIRVEAHDWVSDAERSVKNARDFSREDFPTIIYPYEGVGEDAWAAYVDQDEGLLSAYRIYAREGNLTVSGLAVVFTNAVIAQKVIEPRVRAVVEHLLEVAPRGEKKH